MIDLTVRSIFTSIFETLKKDVKSVKLSRFNDEKDVLIRKVAFNSVSIEHEFLAYVKHFQSTEMSNPCC